MWTVKLAHAFSMWIMTPVCALRCGYLSAVHAQHERCRRLAVWTGKTTRQMLAILQAASLKAGSLFISGPA
eukprot:946143-Rhodomonas_salina.3